MADLHPAVAAILAVTPVDQFGEILTGIELVEDPNADAESRYQGIPDATWEPVWGDPTPVAERQAAAARPTILRELAEELEAREAPAEGKIWLIDAQWLRNRADEIEEAHRGVQA